MYHGFGQPRLQQVWADMGQAADDLGPAQTGPWYIAGDIEPLALRYVCTLSEPLPTLLRQRSQDPWIQVLLHRY